MVCCVTQLASQWQSVRQNSWNCRQSQPAPLWWIFASVKLGNEMMGGFVEMSKVMSNALVSSSNTVHDSAMNVIVHKVGEMKQYVDDKVDAIHDKMDQKMVDVDQKVVQFEKRLASLEKPNKSKKPKTTTRSTVSPNISFANGKYFWRKTISKTPGYKGAYKTIDEAKKGLQKFCQEQLNPAAAMQD